MNKNDIIRCYNCGKVLEKKEDMTKEHIPARNLFDGYDNKYKNNRITVPACFKCNNDYSYTDEEFRNMLGVTSNVSNKDIITQKSVRSIIRNDHNFSRLIFDQLGNVSAVEFDEKPLIDFHKKNFKGLFYHQYGFPLPDNYELIVNIDEDDKSDFTLGIIDYLKSNFEWRVSGHKDIFTYCLQPFRLHLLHTQKSDLEPYEDENLFVAAMIYNQTHGALVYAIRRVYIEGIKQKRYYD